MVNSHWDWTRWINSYSTPFEIYMSYFVYLLKCSDNTLYCGSTNDLHKRLDMHNNHKGAKYTKGRTPVKLVYKEELNSKSLALKREHEIKKLSRLKKMQLISNTV